MSPGDLLGDRFEIERLAGSGASGRVYRARDLRTGDAVAVKVVSGATTDGKAERFAREARVLSELSRAAGELGAEEGVVRYVAHGATEDDEPYLVMEWLDGETLRERLERRGLSTREALALGISAARTLRALHRAGIVHRDLKPGNLFLRGGDPGRVTIIDFGIARMQSVGSEITRTGIMLGTPGYMAPEQARGEPDIDARADVYALGCVLFRCVAGRPAFEGDDVLAVLLRIALEEAPRLSSIRADAPEELDDLVARMMSKSPAARPQDGAGALAELEAVSAIVADQAAPSSHRRPPSITATERRVVCLLVARLSRRAGEDHAEAPGALRAIAERHGATLDQLADGSLLFAFDSERAATDLAARAARCALAVRAGAQPQSIALVAGREVLLSGLPMGEVSDRAARLLARASVAPGAFEAARISVIPPPLSSPRPPSSPPPGPAPIPIDEVIAGLLDARFDLGDEGGLLVLRGERDVSDVGRTLLGRQTPCIGRDRELALLESLLEESVEEGISRAVVVTGPAGIGKSRLRFELTRRIAARGDGVQVWLSRGDPMSAGSPFAMLGRAVRRAAGVLDGEPRAVRARRLSARLARHVSGADLERLSEHIGELCGVPRTDVPSGKPSAPRRDPVLLGDQMRRAWEDWLAAECAAQPVLLVLEDLHWGDLPTVKFIDAALRNLPDARFVVLAFGRPEVTEVFPRLWADRRLTELALGELTRRSCEALVRSALGDAIDPETAARIVERSAGNALYLEELIRAAARGRTDVLPESVLAMVQARLEELDPQARRALRAASVFGQSAWDGGVAALLGGRKTSALDAALTTLADRELLFRRGEGRFPGEVEYSFRHSLVREAAYGMFTDDDLALAHRVAGEWLEAHEDGDAASLAEHFERGHEPARARRWYARAAEQALRGNDLAAAIEAAERGVRCGARGEDLALLRLLQAEAHQWRGEHSEVARVSTEAMSCVPRGTALWYRAVAEAARVSGRLGMHAQLEALADMLDAPPDDPAVLPEYIRALASASSQLLFGGRHSLGAALLDRAERHMSALGGSDPLLLGQMYNARAVLAVCVGDLIADLYAGEAAVAAFESAGDFRSSCHSLVNVGYTYYQLGEHERAVTHLERALSLAERTGTFVLIAFARHNLGIALARLGRFERAASIERAAVEAALGHGDVRLETAARVYLARILEEAGDLAGAAVEAKNAVETSQEGSPMRAYALAALASVQRALGRGADARAYAGAAYSLLCALGSIDDGDAFVRLVFAEIALARGDRAAAEEAVFTAKGRLIARTAKISVPEWQRSFLSRVPENARTLELAAELEGDGA